MCVYTYICIYICIHTHRYICMYLCVCIHIYIYIYIYIDRYLVRILLSIRGLGTRGEKRSDRLPTTPIPARSCLKANPLQREILYNPKSLHYKGKSLHH